MKPRYESGWVGLVEQILVGTADLHGALCADRPELWDPQLEGEDRELTSATRRPRGSVGAAQ